MADPTPTRNPAAPAPAAAPATLGGATYDLLRQRLADASGTLRERMGRLDGRRQEVFGRIESKLLQADRVTTANNCIPRDMVELGAGRFLFGFNVQFGLKKEVDLGDVFAVFARDESTGFFRESPLDPLQDRRFLGDFKRLYQVYDRTVFSKFSLIDGHLYMVFRTGAGPGDIAVFKWVWNGGAPAYVDGRAEAEFRRIGFPPQYDFRWLTPDRESFRYGDHPHVSIEDRVFVECVGGDLTIKVEDNTATGEGVYSEPVVDRHQKVDDAEIAYARLGHLILLRIRPYKEPAARFFIFNEKLQSAVRVDALGQSCARLPEEHGLVFPTGYYLATGELKEFESREETMVLERVVHAPNGEDSLFVFFSREAGEYALLPYRLIGQKIEERIVCHGFSLFPNGHLALFRADAVPQKHHQVQLRQTPFHQVGQEPAGQKDAFLYQVGNKDVVRCLAECNEVLALSGRDNPYAELYHDLVRRCTAVLDAYPWLGSEEGFGVREAVAQVRSVADAAVDEFAKVRRLRQEAAGRVVDIRKRCQERFLTLRRASQDALADFVQNLTALRHLRGELITLREVRYIDVDALAALEKEVAGHLEAVAAGCVKFLLRPEALEPYRRQAEARLAAVDTVTKAADGRSLEKEVAASAAELEMLVEVVNGLRIDDATETTRILDGITAVYATLNRVRAALRKRLEGLVASEGSARFHAQLKLLGQSASGFLDLCDTPEKCDELLNRLTVQLEELEGAFAGFEEFTVQLAERRTEFHEAFEQRKLALVEQRNRRAAALVSAAERILKVVQNRLAGFQSTEEINSYMASDLMTAKVRDTVDQLLALGDPVKADDLQGRLKSVQQEAVRQLRDRQELFVDGTAVIQLGKHRFNVNTQPLDLTLVQRDGEPHFHLTSTRYFDPVTDADFLATRGVWDQEVGSENARVYRAEFLAWLVFRRLETPGLPLLPGGRPGLPETPEAFLALDPAGALGVVQEFMAARYSEGYTKGVHDEDALRILSALLRSHLALRRARFSPAARACAAVWWTRFCPEGTRRTWRLKLRAFAERNRLFPGDPVQKAYVAALESEVRGFLAAVPLHPDTVAPDAAACLFHELSDGDAFTVTREADQRATAFRLQLEVKGAEAAFESARKGLAGDPAAEFELVRDWVGAFLRTTDGTEGLRLLEETAALVFCGDALARTVVDASGRETLEGLRGSHPRIQGSQLGFDYLEFVPRLRSFEAGDVPRFEAYHQAKSRLIDRERRRLRLDEFKPRVLSSFVRNQLTDRVYLPLVGDNLAKQIGAAGSAKRTDLMGLLLLVSPPGYGKTTLLEYVASRLGIVFVKVNGPAIGHNVTSLDPAEAPNAAAREEIHKLNLAFEMGDNALICIDDIQHCSPEFLQKFISLCDGQRKIEGVWRGQPRTYDLRGRKVVVVMAGNPYTESGQKFRIPDMLANRADTYNLGDIIGGNAEWFRASYLENAITSNAVLAPLANRAPADIRALIRMAETGTRDPAVLEGAYSAQELDEILSVLTKLAAIRDTLMRVNAEYIASAAQADEFRTEPPFKLQGSYRNMNRLAEKVVPILEASEVTALVDGHYRGESQTLTTGAEANLLKFREMMGTLTPADAARWEDIRKTFRRNQYTRGADGADPVGRLVSQLSLFQAGLESIQATLAEAANRPREPLRVDTASLAAGLDSLRGVLAERLGPTSRQEPSTGLLGERIVEGLRALGEDLRRAGSAASKEPEGGIRIETVNHELEMVHSTLATLKDLAAQQRDHLQAARELLAARARQGTVEVEVTQEMLANEQAFLERLHNVLNRSRPN